MLFLGILTVITATISWGLTFPPLATLIANETNNSSSSLIPSLLNLTYFPIATISGVAVSLRQDVGMLGPRFRDRKKKLSIEDGKVS